MTYANADESRWLMIRHGLLAALLVAALVAVGTAPTEVTMGDAQRILYVHVSVAWLGLCGFVTMAVFGLLYLLRRDLRHDDWAQAAGELTWGTCSLTLATGSLWAHAAWGTWWTWDPRLLTAFILWAVCCGYLMTRNSVSDPHQRARVSAVVAIVGLLDVPLVIMATRWFRTIHPVSPEMEPRMRMVLLLSICACSALFATLLFHRRKQIRLEQEVADLESQLEL
ncbi:MAG: cytochrome c biogenesis protein CcsA [Planctomycetaceae bacterium]|nr:cytochrome c biogenesis protein CcsA [Planctomycetaceae bacterium]